MNETNDNIRGSKLLKLIEGENGKTDFEKKRERGKSNCNPIGREPFPVIEAGNYYLGPVVKKYVRNPVTQCLARRKGTDDYYLMKILVLKDGNMKDKLHLHRRALFHNEYSILSLLKGHPGVLQIYDFFKDSIPVEDAAEIAKGRREQKRMCMVIECLIPHGSHNLEYTPLPEYLAEKRRLTESEALHIFGNLMLVIDDLHNRNIVHHDLKLSNVILNRRTLKIKLQNFYYAKLLSSDSELSFSQRGNPSYASPDVASGKPIAPKPCDIWSAGVILYTMLHGYLPFVKNPNWMTALANSRPISDGCVISNDISVSEGTKRLLRGLLTKDPKMRLKSSDAVDIVSTTLAHQLSSHYPCSQYTDQIVPECARFEETRESIRNPDVEFWPPEVADSSLKGENFAAPKTDPRESEEDDKGLMKCERDVLSRKINSRKNSMSRNNKIKVAMLRLGATSINNISALAFNYSERNTSRSQL